MIKILLEKPRFLASGMMKTSCQRSKNFVQSQQMRFLRHKLFAVCALLGLSNALAGSYTVKPGDTAFSIAARFGIKADELLKRNKLVSPALHVGQVLDVPDQPVQAVAPVTRKHTVAPGETLFSIARKYGSSVDAIRALNKLGDVPLKVGQVLDVPGAPTSSSTASSPSASNTPASSSTQPSTRPTVTVSPSPPPLPDLGAPPPAPSSQTKPTVTPQKPALPNPAVVSGANVKPTVAAPVPPGPLPRGVVTLPPPDPNNPFGEAKEQPISDGPIKTSSGAPLPDLGAPPNSPADSSATSPDTASTSSATVSSDPGTVGTEPEILHSVARGDTLTSISKRYNVDVNAIRQANTLASDSISIGQILKIPVLQPAPSTGPTGTNDLRGAAERYLGVTYRFGGSSNDGLDCSGFVVIVFNELGIRVPRTSAQLFTFGQPVERTDLQLGDLVFFNTTGQGVSHVGIYLSEGEFIHAASNPGRVIKSKLIEPYYAQRYLGARRVMTDE
jgi:cell wall-associated NlpC family hydrolase